MVWVILLLAPSLLTALAFCETCSVAFNTGLFAARNRPATRAFLRAWFETLTDSGKEHHSDSEHRGIDDQLALNLMFDPGLVSAIGPGEHLRRCSLALASSQLLPMHSRDHVGRLQAGVHALYLAMGCTRAGKWLPSKQHGAAGITPGKPMLACHSASPCR